MTAAYTSLDTLQYSRPSTLAPPKAQIGKLRQFAVVGPEPNGGQRRRIAEAPPVADPQTRTSPNPKVESDGQTAGTSSVEPSNVERMAVDRLEWRVDRLEADRALNAPMVELLRKGGFDRKAARLAMCGEIEAREKCGLCDYSGEAQVHRWFCNQPNVCVICARKESSRMVRQTVDQVKAILKKPVSGYRFRLVTLTKKTGGQYAEAVDSAIKARGLIWKNVLGGRKHKNAGMRSGIEFGEKDGNVHVHGLYYGPYVPQNEISEAWERYTGDSCVVDIRAGKGAIEELIKEVMKYITKFEATTPDRRYEYFLALEGRKRHMSNGLFRNDVLSRHLGYDYAPSEHEPVFDTETTPCPKCGGLCWQYVRSDSVFVGGLRPNRHKKPKPKPPKVYLNKPKKKAKLKKDSEAEFSAWLRQASDKAEAQMFG